MGTESSSCRKLVQREPICKVWLVSEVGVHHETVAVGVVASLGGPNKVLIGRRCN